MKAIVQKTFGPPDVLGYRKSRSRDAFRYLGEGHAQGKVVISV